MEIEWNTLKLIHKNSVLCREKTQSLDETGIK